MLVLLIAETNPMGKRIRLEVFVLAALIFILFLASPQFQAVFFTAVFWLEDIIRLHPLLGGTLFLLLSGLSAMLAFASSLVLLPSALLAWGPTTAFLLLFGGWILGAVVAYAIGSRFIHPLLRPFIPKDRLARYQEAISMETPFPVILLFCLSVPSEIPGYILGAARYHFGKFILAITLTEAIYAIGAVLVVENLLDQHYAYVIGAAAALSLVAIGASTIFIRRKHRTASSAATSRLP